MNKKLLLLCVLLFQLNLSNSLNAQTELIKDINPDGGWSNIEYLFEIGNVVYFNARNGADIELWRSDGTTDGTHMVKEINPGSDSANPQHFTELNGKWIFTANDGTLGVELWITDGTEAGTMLLRDINPTFYSSNPTRLTRVGNQVFFAANTVSSGKELWVTDGTATGTKMVMDIFPGTSSSIPVELTDVNGTLYFGAMDSTENFELWKSDGTPAGTQMVKDIMIGINGSSPGNLTNVGGKLFFAATNATNGRELWQSDGTTAGTVLVADIKPGFAGSFPDKLTSIGNKLYFTADDGVNGLEFWWTDGSVAMPNLVVENIYPGQDSSSPFSFFAGNDLLYFIASDGMSSQELWRSDGTVGGTFLLKDINPGFNSSNIKIYAEIGNTLYFEAYESDHGVELWKTDGTSANTELVKDINPGPEFSNPLNFKVDGNELYFTAFEPEKLWQVWRTNPTTNETLLVTELPSEEFNGGLYKPQYVKRDGETIFVVHFGIGFGEEYYRFTPDPFTIDTFYTNSPLACNGDQTGTISFDFSGGLGPDAQFSFEWNGGSMSGSSLANLPAGNYSLTITDCGGNTAVANTQIEEAAALQVNSSNTMDVQCNGDASGSIEVMIAGGTPNYQYIWSNNATTNMLSGLAAGGYNLTVTDDNNCSLEQAFSIDEPNAIEITTQELSAISCFGMSDGEATANLSGGMGAYSFLWSNGMTTQTIMNLTQGNYTVTVTDANNCSNTSSLDISEPTALSAIATESMPAPCGGGGFGAASVSVTGGTGMYQYLWDNNATTSSPNALTAGMHSVTVTDANNCSFIANVEITEVANFITTVDVNDISCLGAVDGQAEISVIGNPADYIFIWEGGATTAAVSDLGIGLYTVTVTNTLNGCEQIQNVNVTGATADISLDNQVSCFGLSDGGASVMINNGAGNYTYLWTSNETNATAGSLGIGTNTVTVTDANNCSVELSLSISQPDELMTTGNVIANLACFGDSNGEANVSTSGGTGNYTYLWDSGITNAMANNLDAGTHMVTVTDANDCTSITSVDLTQPDELVLTGSMTAATGSNADGTASVDVVGGTGDYSYSWNTNPVQMTQTITGLLPGDYIVTVTDDNDCIKTLTITVDMKVAVANIQGLEDFQIMPNPTKGKTSVNLSFNSSKNVKLELFDPIGHSLQYQAAEGTIAQQFEFDFSDLPNGVYYLKLTVNGASMYKKIVLSKN